MKDMVPTGPSAVRVATFASHDSILHGLLLKGLRKKNEGSFCAVIGPITTECYWSPPRARPSAYQLR